MNWGCSTCKPQFLKVENVRCHVLRNAKCLALNATQVRLSNHAPQPSLIRDPEVNRISVECKENKKEEVIVQRPAVPRKKRTGVRPFPPALISRVAKEGKELAKTNGRRMAARILL